MGRRVGAELGDAAEEVWRQHEQLRRRLGPALVLEGWPSPAQVDALGLLAARDAVQRLPQPLPRPVVLDANGGDERNCECPNELNRFKLVKQFVKKAKESDLITDLINRHGVDGKLKVAI